MWTWPEVVDHKDNEKTIFRSSSYVSIHYTKFLKQWNWILNNGEKEGEKGKKEKLATDCCPKVREF